MSRAETDLKVLFEERDDLGADSTIGLNSDLRERALRMLRQVEAGSRRRRDRDGKLNFSTFTLFRYILADFSNGGGKEFEDRSDDLRINTWNQLEVFAPVVAAAWHSKGKLYGGKLRK